MSYISPDMVISPKNMVSRLEVVFDGGENQWSVAKFRWDGEPVVGIRWNGGSNDKRFPGMGNPQSRGVPTWFILPEPLADVVLNYGIAHAAKKYGLQPVSKGT